VAAIALAALVVFRPRPSPADQIPRIAVLPLRNVSGDPRHDALAEAMTEELISMLGREPDKLRAIPSTSVSRFRDRQTDLRAIAETLGVPNVVEGTLTRLDDRLRLILRLVDGRDHSSRWTGTYDGETRDILAEPPRIAHDVARELGVRLTGARGTGLLASGARGDRVPDGRMAAADLYVRGRSGELFRTAAGRQQAMSFFRGAIVADSTIAPAHAVIATMLTMQDRYIAGTRREQLALAHRFAQQAIGLDSSLAVAQFALGRFLMADYQLAKAEAQFKRAIDLDPTQTEYREYLAQLYVFMDRPRDALIEAERALDGAPYSPNATAELARAWLVNGDCAKALEIGDQLKRMQPPPARAPFIAAQCYARQQMWQQAIDVMRPVAAANPREAGPVLGFVLAQAGQTREASAMRDTLLGEARRGAVGAYSMAILYAGLRDFDNAFAWLDKAIEDRSLRFQIMEPGFEELHRDPRFASLRAKLEIGPRSPNR
jgi:TolB-like protein/tetratricopeptide (TPR) repeat protein